MVNKLGPNQTESEFKIYKDSKRLVRIHISPSGSALGIIDNYSPGYVYLKPSLSSEGAYNLDGSSRNNTRIETEIPHKINIASITNIEPLSNIKYLKDLSDSLNSVGKPSPEIIIVKR